MNHDLKPGLIARGDEAFLSLTLQINHLLDAIEAYTNAPVIMTGSRAMKIRELEKTISILGALPYQLADVLKRWKNNETRVLSVLGVELQLLNEIWATIETLKLFFDTEEFDLGKFNRGKAANAFADLIAVNKLIEN